MQAVQLVLLASGITLGAAWLAARFSGHPLAARSINGVLPGILLGITAGLIGAIIVAVLSYDSVPDDAEGMLRVVAIVAVSLVALVGSLYRISRR